jgi:hypothetical protein
LDFVATAEVGAMLCSADTEMCEYSAVDKYLPQRMRGDVDRHSDGMTQEGSISKT